MYPTLAHAKEACSKDTRCVGLENPTCDNFSSRSCSAIYYRTTVVPDPYEGKAVLSNYGNCIYLKAERHGKWILQNIMKLINLRWVSIVGNLNVLPKLYFSISIRFYSLRHRVKECTTLCQNFETIRYFARRHIRSAWSPWILRRLLRNKKWMLGM